MSSPGDRIKQANCHGTVSIGGVSMNRPAWAIMDVHQCWRRAPYRGGNLPIPYQAGGGIKLPRIKDAAERTFQLLVVGTISYDGSISLLGPQVGLEYNINYLMNNLFAYAEETGWFDCTLTLPSGATRSGTIQLGEPDWGVNIGSAVTLTCPYTLVDGQLD